MATLEGRLVGLAQRIRDQFNLIRPRLLPQGGTAGQVLAKSTADDYLAAWVTPAAAPAGGSGGVGLAAFRTLAIQQSAIRGAYTTYFRGIADSFVSQSGMAVTERAQSLPSMTGNASPAPYVVTDSTNKGDGNEVPWRAFDGVYNAGGGAAWVSSGSLPAWLQRTNPTADTMWAYTLTARNDGYGKPSAWTLAGSNDGAAFTTLDTRSGVTLTNGVTTQFVIPPENRAAFRVYRITISALTSSGQSASLAEVEFLKQFAPFDSTNYFFMPSTSSFTNVSGGQAYAMDLRSIVFPVDDVPASTSFLMLVQVTKGTLALNTNLIAQASRDGGATWTSFALTDIGSGSGFRLIQANSIDLSAQPQGKGLRYRVLTMDAIGILLDSAAFEYAT